MFVARGVITHALILLPSTDERIFIRSIDSSLFEHMPLGIEPKKRLPMPNTPRPMGAVMRHAARKSSHMGYLLCAIVV